MCIDPHQTGSVAKGSDHLQLIKFWRSCAPRRGSVVGRIFFTPAYYSQRTVYASLRALFFTFVCFTSLWFMSFHTNQPLFLPQNKESCHKNVHMINFSIVATLETKQRQRSSQSEPNSLSATVRLLTVLHRELKCPADPDLLTGLEGTPISVLEWL